MLLSQATDAQPIPLSTAGAVFRTVRRALPRVSLQDAQCQTRGGNTRLAA